MSAAVYNTEVGRAYVRIADLSECTIGAQHAIDIAEWVVEQRHPIRSRLERRARGFTTAWRQAQALREHYARLATSPADTETESETEA